MSEDLRAGKITLEEFHEAESCMHRSHGHCMTMGTASTMASMMEALGVGMPGNAAIPAVDAAQCPGAHGRTPDRGDGERKLVLSKILVRPAFENAIRARRDRRLDQRRDPPDRHRAAHRGRAGLEDFDRLGRGVHTLVNLMPSGKYLMEDFYYAGGLPAVLRELARTVVEKDALTVNGKTLGERQGRRAGTAT